MVLGLGACDRGDDPSMDLAIVEALDAAGPPIEDSADVAQDTESERTLAQERVLAEFDLLHEHYAFIELSAFGERHLMMTTRGDGSRSSMLGALRRDAEEPTLLEIFEALAPADLAVPEALVQSHSEEARALGRDDLAVRAIQVDKVLTEPGVSVCADSHFFWSPLQWYNRMTGGSWQDAFVCVSDMPENPQAGVGIVGSSTCSYTDTHRMMVGICTTLGSVTAYAGYGTASTWASTSSVVLPVNHYYWWTFAASSTNRRLAAQGLTGGSTSVFGLRSGQAL